jgi:hypothetical protein
MILSLFPGMARANNMSVDCNAGGSINAALATLTPTVPNQITVTGTCNRPNLPSWVSTRQSCRGVAWRLEQVARTIKSANCPR